jgi:hypothetical protein
MILVQFPVWVAVFIVSTRSSSAFYGYPVIRSKRHHRLQPLFSSKDDAASGSGGGIVKQSDTLKTQLLNAFTNLGTADQYDAVLTGLCAKILDDTSMSERQALVSIQDCIDLMEEMNQARIPAAQRSLMALLDATTKTQSAQCMARVMRLCIRNNNNKSGKAETSIQQYGMQQRDIRLFPLNANAKVLCPDGTYKTLRERLAATEAIPGDDRASEMASAGVFGAIAVTSELINLNSAADSFEHIAASAILTLMVSVTVVDNCYDVLQFGSNFVVSQIQTDAEQRKTWQLPDKSSLPLGLGSGAITGTVVRGFSRLFTVDSARESQCEAAALYAAYVLGLPCFAYRPNALEASTLVAESADEQKEVDHLCTASGILRTLIWLLAPVAMERMTHPVLIMSDPREATGFLRRLEDYFGAEDDRLFWINPKDAAATEQSKDDLLQWAFAEADVLLRNNKAVVLELSDRLNSGAATIGDCIAVIESW